MRTQHYVAQQPPVAAETSMNGAALVMADGHEIPITNAMIQEALDALVEEEEWKMGERFELPPKG
ncbi:PA1571 family protein [Mangrovitalea sediminis]|uniref:PA1571 family protein n=1 Tax=Mangrovitalea sediminis TaxID=1982043 RepID=UPI000BE60143|nr:PA1571 family protein [Mangrovitalea sediminis]